MRIGWLGVGHLALYCVPPLARRFTVTLSPRGASASKTLAEELGLAIAADNAALVDGSDLVFLAPRPAHAVAAAEGLPWRGDQIVVSLAAGLPMAALRAAVAPAHLCRAMPVLAARWSESPTLLLPDLPAARQALEALGPVVAPADEAAFEIAATAAVFYSWLMRLQSDLADSLAAGGLPPDQARLLTAQTFRAVGTVGREDLGESLQAIVAALCSPGSYSRKGLERLEAADAFAPWPDAARYIMELLRGKP